MFLSPGRLSREAGLSKPSTLSLDTRLCITFYEYLIGHQASDEPATIGLASARHHIVHDYADRQQIGRFARAAPRIEKSQEFQHGDIVILERDSYVGECVASRRPTVWMLLADLRPASVVVAPDTGMPIVGRSIQDKAACLLEIILHVLGAIDVQIVAK